MLKSKGMKQYQAADKAGMSQRSAHKYLKSRKLPCQMQKEHDWRTRKDTFKDDWPEICGMLEVNSGLEAKTIFEYYQREYPGRYEENQLRTLQRRIKIWRATQGTAKELYFQQIHYSGDLCASDFTHMNSLGITILKGDFLGHNENVLIFGNPGSGKTHLICALAQELIRRDRRIYFSTCAMLLQELLQAKKELRLKKILKKLSLYDAIIIDDIGYVQQEMKEMEVLFTLLAERYEHGSIMITSNLPFSKWENIFKDPMMTAAVDRIVHHSVILELNIGSYRMDTAKKRKVKEAY